MFAPHYGEFLDFGGGDEVVHSASWPVLNRTSWICEMDSFGYTTVFGRHILAPATRDKHYPFNAPDALEITRQRVALMLSAYSHPSCKAILYYTRLEYGNMVKWIRRLGLEREGDSFLRKCHMVRPSCTPLTAEEFQIKWKRATRLHLVFCGLSFAAKNGAIALEAFRRILDSGIPVQLTYVGDIPPPWLQKYRDTLKRIEYYPGLPRNQLLTLFAMSHVLFHPSPSESYGMVLVEGAALGMVILAARRNRIALSSEFLDPSGGPLLDPNRIPAEQEAEWFARKITTLASSKELCERMAHRNWRKTINGEFSVRRRNRILLTILRRSLRGPTSPCLSLGELTGKDKIQLVRVSSKVFRELHQQYREKVNLVGRNIVI